MIYTIVELIVYSFSASFIFFFYSFKNHFLSTHYVMCMKHNPSIQSKQETKWSVLWRASEFGGTRRATIII